MHRTIEHSYRGLITFANFVDLMCTLVLPNTKEPYQYNKFIKKAFKVRACVNLDVHGGARVWHRSARC